LFGISTRADPLHLIRSQSTARTLGPLWQEGLRSCLFLVETIIPASAPLRSCIISMVQASLIHSFAAEEGDAYVLSPVDARISIIVPRKDRKLKYLAKQILFFLVERPPSRQPSLCRRPALASFAAQMSTWIQSHPDSHTTPGSRPLFSSWHGSFATRNTSGNHSNCKVIRQGADRAQVCVGEKSARVQWHSKGCA
jgi:hypothetical protein